MSGAAAVFWASVAVVLYVYAGFPLLLAVLGRFVRKRTPTGDHCPFVSIVVPAYNEGRVIEAKIRNVLNQDYPADRYELIIASDGSTDSTNLIARRFADGLRVRVFDFDDNRGKISVLNDVVPRARGELIAFSDATSMLGPKAIRALVAPFGDPAVGAVSGVYRVDREDQATLGSEEAFYWKYETYIKTQEARAGALLGAHGSLYAIRRELYPFPPPTLINDDFVIPLSILHQGFRVEYEPGAAAFEAAEEMEGFSRRVRIMAGNIQQLGFIGWLLRPIRPLALFFFLSHKLGRVVAPIFLLLALATNFALVRQLPYAALFGAQASFYLLAGLGALGLQSRAARLPLYFCMINTAALVAMLCFLLPGKRIAWDRRREHKLVAHP